ncbi:MAG: type II toxin-antitoxin system ParD family antitoxin [Trueperaceae bacterium]|nr:MAG: type II toxin-antitoxin system ParD family antitoxin [Trueperaceae bacterium]
MFVASDDNGGMHVSLTPELEAFVREKVASGLYNNSSEVVREALRLLRRRDELESAKLELLKQEIERGLESIRRGELHSFDIDEFVKEMRDRR